MRLQRTLSGSFDPRLLVNPSITPKLYTSVKGNGLDHLLSSILAGKSIPIRHLILFFSVCYKGIMILSLAIYKTSFVPRENSNDK